MVKSTCLGCWRYQVRDCESLDVVFWKVVLVLWICIYESGMYSNAVPSSGVLFDLGPLCDHQEVRSRMLSRTRLIASS